MSFSAYYYSNLPEIDGQKCDSFYDFSNSTDEELAGLFTPRDIATMYLYILPAVLAIGLFSNAAFFFVVLRLKRMRTITNFYLLNLAVADVGYLLTGVIEKLARTVISPIYNDQVTFGQATCVLVYLLLNTASFASLFLVTLVTIEKFYAVCFPLKHRRVTGRRRTIKLVVFVWTLAFIFAASLVPSHWLKLVICVVWPNSRYYQDLAPFVGACWPISDLAVNVAHGIQTIPFFLAMVPNTVMYIQIIRTLHTRVGATEELHSSRENSLRMRNQVARMLVVNGTLFFLLAAPFHVLSFVIMMASLNPNAPDSLWAGIDKAIPPCQLLLYMNSAINPFVYSAANSRYRQAYWQAFCWGGTKVAASTDEQETQQKPTRINTISTSVS